jgi:methyltransferase (TIGR00027 family)
MKSISDMAFFCCGVRMLDSETDNPVCNDYLAKRFMDDDGLEILHKFPDKGMRAANVARHRIIDDLLKNEIKKKPETVVILIGAGFDTRAYRFNGGIWIELDHQKIINYKNNCLPIAECANKLHRISCDFTRESFEEKLNFIEEAESIIIVVEGVFLYLTEKNITTLLTTLQNLFPRHLLICELQRYSVLLKFKRKSVELMAGAGAAYKFKVQKPEQIFTKNKYKTKKIISVITKTIEWNYGKVAYYFMKTFIDTFFKDMKASYRVFVFEYTK